MTSLRMVLLAVLLLVGSSPLRASAGEAAAEPGQPAAAGGCPGRPDGGACCASCQDNAAKLAAAGDTAAANAPAHECPCQRARRLKEQAAAAQQKAQ